MNLRVILDTNFVMIPAQFRLDIFEEMERVLNRKVEAVVPSPVYEEVQRLAKGRGLKRRRQAKVAMKLMERAHILKVE
ncbi:MAG: PIN domain-containing protein, partial [Candidatus Bathyarchaeia archaeon]